jgi:hypothetical protein
MLNDFSFDCPELINSMQIYTEAQALEFQNRWRREIDYLRFERVALPGVSEKMVCRQMYGENQCRSGFWQDKSTGEWGYRWSMAAQSAFMSGERDAAERRFAFRSASSLPIPGIARKIYAWINCIGLNYQYRYLARLINWLWEKLMKSRYQ